MNFFFCEKLLVVLRINKLTVLSINPLLGYVYRTVRLVTAGFAALIATHVFLVAFSFFVVVFFFSPFLVFSFVFFGVFGVVAVFFVSCVVFASFVLSVVCAFFVFVV